MMSKLRVAILFGGPSSEHEISCASASGVLGAIDRSKYEVIAVGITKHGDWTLAADDASKWALRKGDLAVVEDEGNRVAFATDGSRELVLTDATGTRSLGVVDVVFPVLHGPYGEDGQVQRELEAVGVAYVGSGVLASERGMDKELSKDAFLAADISATPHVVLTEDSFMRDPESALEKIGLLGPLPIFVKPARAGSSKGVSKVKNLDQLGEALETAFAEDQKVVIERGLSVREIEFAVLESRDGGRPKVSVPGEIVVKSREFYDFDAKYQDEDSVDLIVPAVVEPALLAKLQESAADAFVALGCEGLARADFFVTADGYFVNELNTMPGFTPLSMYPALWKASGLGYSDLIDELIALGIQRSEKN
ncbi:MAG: D-alanine--D-alanine ligase [Actinobacteria bacterium]|nr:D-alanine--D-alanine ligase [Actinomycetota bacterium]